MLSTLTWILNKKRGERKMTFLMFLWNRFSWNWNWVLLVPLERYWRDLQLSCFEFFDIPVNFFTADILLFIGEILTFPPQKIHEESRKTQKMKVLDLFNTFPIMQITPNSKFKKKTYRENTEIFIFLTHLFLFKIHFGLRNFL